MCFCLIQVGIKAWKSARDSTGFTPEDYARLRGHYSYIHLVQKKINKRPAVGHVVLSMDHEWCAVVKKLLSILLKGVVGTGEHSSLNLALSELGLLHRAVRKNSRPLVELLLRYVPGNAGPENKLLIEGSHDYNLFRPDVTGPAGLTPLHIAAGKDGSEDVLDALTEDPGMVILFIINLFMKMLLKMI